MKLLPIFVFLMFASIGAHASFDFNENCKLIYNQIINLQITEARTGIASEQKNNPENKISILLENYIDFIGVVTGETETDLDKLTAARNRRLQSISSENMDSPWFLHTQGMIYLQNAMAKMMFDERVSAGMDFSNAFHLIEENTKKYPSFLPGKSALGFMQTLAGTIPDDYRWMLKPFKISGSVEEGLQNVKQSFESAKSSPAYKFMLPEIAFCYSFLAINIANDKVLTANMINEYYQEPLASVLKNSQLLRFAFVNMLIKTGKNDEAISLLKTPLQIKPSAYLNSLNYQLGLCKLNRQDKDAHIYLLKFTSSSRGSAYIRSAYERIAWFYLLKNDTANYNFYMKRILLRGSNLIDSDKQAYGHAKNHIVPERRLLCARLLFDGGYYDKALEVLQDWKANNHAASKDFQLEYIYRTARVYDCSGRVNEAISWYRETIISGNGSGSYLPANAALQLGLLYERTGDKNQARTYFQKVLSMDFDEYRFSIRQKAKAGMNRIENP